MSGLSSVKVMWGAKEKVPTRSPNRRQSDAWCNIPLGGNFLFLLCFPFSQIWFLWVAWRKNCRFDFFNCRSYIASNYQWQLVTKINKLHMTLVCATLLLLSTANVLIWHFCAGLPDKVLCTCDLFWIGQFASTHFLCLSFACFLRFSCK